MGEEGEGRRWGRGRGVDPRSMAAVAGEEMDDVVVAVVAVGGEEVVAAAVVVAVAVNAVVEVGRGDQTSPRSAGGSRSGGARRSRGAANDRIKTSIRYVLDSSYVHLLRYRPRRAMEVLNVPPPPSRGGDVSALKTVVAASAIA